MQTTIRITLDDTHETELRCLARQSVGRISERCHFVMLAGKGYSAREIGELMDYSINTVKHWLCAYLTHGAGGLVDQPRSGRPLDEPHLTDVLEAQASQSPTCFGYLQTVWTLALLVIHLGERFKLKCSKSTVRRAFKLIRYSWHRPKLSPAKRPDPLAEERRRGLDAALTDQTATVLALDESDFCLLATLRSMWQRIAEQVRLPTPGKNAKIGIFGAINLRTGTLTTLCSPRKRSLDFIRFLDKLLGEYATGMIRIVLDNASIHDSAVTRTWLTQHPRISLVFLPTYSGHQLNPIEKVWWQLKQHVSANRNFKSLDELIMALERWFLAAQPAALLELINCDVQRRASYQMAPTIGVKNFSLTT